MSAKDKSVFRYKHGATSRKYNENDLILWETIKYAKKEGYKYFDFGGVNITEDKKSYYYGHYKYKEKFGGNISDFYSYIKLKGIFSFFGYFSNFFVKIFLKDNYTNLVNLLNRLRILR